MPKTRAANPSQTAEARHDRRTVVLVVIGLCLCLPHLYHTLKPVPDQHLRYRLLWLETAVDQGGGLYWQDDQARSWPALYAALGSPPPPSAALAPSSDESVAAYRLSAADPPQPIPLPARLAPIFFQPIPINQASAEALMTIPGIGPRLADAILAFRAKSGSIKDRAALLAIDGIGAKKAATIAAHVRFE